jgi:hypothetical protein
LPETSDGLDQRGVLDGARAVVMDAVWREAHDRAQAALEMPGIVVVLGPAGVSGNFLQELIAGLRERGRAVTFVPRPDLPRWWPAGSALVIEDAAQMDAALLEAICRPPGRRIVLAGLPASALAELPAPLAPAPLTVVTLEPLSPQTAAAISSMNKAWVAIESGVLASALAKLPAPLIPAPLPVATLEPLSPGTAAAPRSSARSNALLSIASGVLAATCVAGALLWIRAPPAPPAPAPSHVAALQPAIELPPAPESSPPPAPSASEQGGEAASAVPVIAQPEPRSDSEPAPPQLQAGSSPVPESHQALNMPPEPAARSENALQLLPDNAPIRVLVRYAPRSAAARQEAAGVVRLLRGGGLAASDPAPAARVAGKAGINYFFAEDRDGARRVEHDLGEGFGPSRLSRAGPGAPLPRPGTIEVLVPAR